MGGSEGGKEKQKEGKKTQKNGRQKGRNKWQKIKECKNMPNAKARPRKPCII